MHLKRKGKSFNIPFAQVTQNDYSIEIKCKFIFFKKCIRGGISEDPDGESLLNA